MNHHTNEYQGIELEPDQNVIIEENAGESNEVPIRHYPYYLRRRSSGKSARWVTYIFVYQQTPTSSYTFVL